MEDVQIKQPLLGGMPIFTACILLNKLSTTRIWLVNHVGLRYCIQLLIFYKDSQKDYNKDLFYQSY